MRPLFFLAATHLAFVFRSRFLTTGSFPLNPGHAPLRIRLKSIAKCIVGHLVLMGTVSIWSVSTLSAPLDEFLTAMPGYKPMHGEAEIGLGVMNRTVDLFGVRKGYLNAKQDFICAGDYKDYHLRGGLALTRRLWVDGGLWKRSVKTQYDEGENHIRAGGHSGGFVAESMVKAHRLLSRVFIFLGWLREKVTMVLECRDSEWGVIVQSPLEGGERKDPLTVFEGFFPPPSGGSKRLQRGHCFFNA